MRRAPGNEGEQPRRAADLTSAVELKHSRARLWRYPPHSTGRRHRDHAQEEVFVVVSGTLTMLLGDEPERVDLGPGGVVAVQPMTPLQLRNESDEELVVFVYGAPPLQEGADFLDDVELLPGDSSVARRLREHEVAVLRVDADRVAVAEVAFEQPQRERVLEQPLDRALQRTRAVGRVPARLDDRLLRGVRQLEREPALGEPLAQALELQLDDLAELLAA